MAVMNPMRCPKCGYLMYNQAKVKSMYPNSFNPWSVEEYTLLKEEVKAGKDILELSKIFGRAPTAIKSKCDLMGLEISTEPMDDMPDWMKGLPRGTRPVKNEGEWCILFVSTGALKPASSYDSVPTHKRISAVAQDVKDQEWVDPQAEKKAEAYHEAMRQRNQERGD